MWSNFHPLTTCLPLALSQHHRYNGNIREVTQKAFPLINLHSVDHNDKAKRGSFFWVQINSKEKTKISHWLECPDPQVPLISLDHLWDASTPRLESTCVESNWLDMIWKRHTPLYTKVSQELPAKLRDRIVSRLQKHVCCIEGSQELTGFHDS